jgi:hypothetical protein
VSVVTQRLHRGGFSHSGLRAADAERRTSWITGPAVKARVVVAVRPGLACPAVTALAPLAELPGVAAAGEEAREALGRAHRHRTNLRGWQTTAAEAALRAARASSVLDGGSMQIPEAGEPDPVLAGALRVSQALEGGAMALVGVWQRAPLQALARLHMLAAADLVDDDRLGRPRVDDDVGRRLELLADVVTGATRVPAPVLAAVAHGELLTLAPFGTADGVMARG